MKFKNKQLKNLLERYSYSDDERVLFSTPNTSLTGHVMGMPHDMGYTPQNELETIVRSRKIVDATSALLGSGAKFSRDMMLRVAPGSRRLLQTANKERSVLNLFKKPVPGTVRQLGGAIDTGISFLGQYGMHKFKEGLKNVGTAVLTKMADFRNEPSRIKFDSAPFEFIRREPRKPIQMKKEKLMSNLPGPSAYEMATIQGINVNRKRRSDSEMQPETKPGIYRPK